VRVAPVRDRVERDRRVGREDEVTRRRPDERRQPQPRRLEQLRKPPFRRQELDGPALELELEALVGLEHRPWAGAERPVVQEDHVGIEEEKILHSP
jgi:hypothetical protein